ncbi:MAG: Clp protease ClpP [Melioribacteraceae bacterium]|jgi:ATP-dependent Clp endopeptidase proteolytic subunit ClpP|nr:Clp protease ClpP [Melioribacteraceae bacterium]
MPYKNEHAARINDPKDFIQDSFRRKNIADGVDIITGKLTGEDTMTTQAYRFDVLKFTSDEAEKWLKDNDVKDYTFEAAENDQVNEGHIFVYGEIIPWQDEKAKEYGGVNLKDVVNQINNNKEAERLVVHVHSPGGDVWEGFAIHDALVRTGKEIETVIEGLCASIATVIALAGDRRLMTQHSEFMIHNPWTFGIGDSEDLKKQSDELAKTESKLAEFYEKHTSLSKDELLNYMHNETFFTAEEAQNFGFITEIVNTIKQVAKMSEKTKTQLDTEQAKKLNGISTILDRIWNKLNPAKALVIQDVNGKEIDFGDAIKTQEEIKVGVTAKVDGNPASGDYTLSDGTVYKFEAGTLNEIVEPAGDDEEMQKLKEENEKLKADLAAAQANLTSTQGEFTKIKSEFEIVKNEFVDFKSQFSTGDIPPNTPGSGNAGSRKAFKS